MNRRNLLLGGGLLFAAWLAFFADPPKDEISPAVERKAARTPRADASRPAARAQTASQAKSGTKANASASAVVILALQEREDLFGAAKPENSGNSKDAPTAHVGKGDKPAPAAGKPAPLDKSGKPGKPGQPNKAAAKPEDTPPQEALFDSQTWTPPPPPPPKPTPPPPPVAPPLAFTVIGKKLEEGKWEVFLARGEQIFIAKEKAVLDNNYRVESIKPPTLTVTYLPLNQTQTLTIGGPD